MNVCAIVPVRAGGTGKTRLAARLTSAERAELVASMLARVLQALRRAHTIDHIVVVTDDAHLVPPGVELIHDRGAGENVAVRLALDHVAGRADAAIVIAADTPHVTAAEIDTLVTSARERAVAVVPDRRGTGTNALWIRFPAAIGPHFGEGSLVAHQRAATAAGVQALVMDLPGLARDVDLPEDLDDEPLSRDDAQRLADTNDLPTLTARASRLALRGFGTRVSYSRKVFIPLTQLCRDVCHYCTFAGPPRRGTNAYLTADQVLEIARSGARAGCHEALFTLGDNPELRYSAARAQLSALGFRTTLEYLAHCAKLVFDETGLLPHLNAGILGRDDMSALRRVSVSMGLMLETSAERLSLKGGPHHRSPDKQPATRLAVLRAAGEAEVPFTTGLLIGIGETRRERIEALLAIRDLHHEFGHIQDLIVQNFRAKPGTRMAHHPEPSLEELQWTIAVARLVFGPAMSIQAPPNLSPGRGTALIEAGINDWGGVSPVTTDHVNPEAPWPAIGALERETEAAGRWLVERLAIVPSFAVDGTRWLDPSMRTAVLRRIDATGYVREDEWHAGAGDPPPSRYDQLVQSRRGRGHASTSLRAVLGRSQRGDRLDAADVTALFAADGADLAAVFAAADELRDDVVGDTVTYVVNRNINYTNICSYACSFCAFAKGHGVRSPRGPAYDLDLHEMSQRVREAAARGATEVCLQGGIHPRYTGRTYLDIVRAAVEAVADIHVHAFSPLEIVHGAETLGLSVRDYLAQLRAAGLRTIPGTAAEILCDDVRQLICPDKLRTDEWLNVMREAHQQGIRSTATIMFGHVERPRHWAQHLLAIRDLQAETGGFTEFVPLPFVHMEAPMWRAGWARSGPSFREALLMHAVARLALHPLIHNVQASWVKLGRAGALTALAAGANDLGGVLMNESITRAAGGVNGQEMGPAAMQAAIRSIGREPRQRTTLYAQPAEHLREFQCV